jgi:hypothetical protein
MSKIIVGLQHAVDASKCDHEFEYEREHLVGFGGVIGRCVKCKCRFSAWPQTAHYDKILAAKK